MESTLLLAVDVQTFKYELEVTAVNILVIGSEDLAETASSCCFQSKTGLHLEL